MQPTSALTRAVVVGTATGALAVLAGRSDLLLLAVPLLVWALIALARRTARVEDAEDSDGEATAGTPRLRTTALSVVEGGSVGVEIAAEPGTLVAATAPVLARADLDPPLGSGLDADAMRLDVTARRWGRYEIGPLHVHVVDPLGAFRSEHRLEPARMRVTPDSTTLQDSGGVPTPIGISGVHLSRRRGDGTALADVREFQPGDRRHRINWRVTSRTGRLHTNATFTEQDTDVLLVTDTLLDVAPPGLSHAAGTRAALRGGAQEESSLDMTVRAVAAIARHYLGAGDRVALHDVGRTIGSVPAGTGSRQLRVLLDALSRAKRPTGLADSARSSPLPAVRASTLVIVVSPLLSEQTTTQIGVLRSRGADVIVVDTLPPALGDIRRLPRAGRSLRSGGAGGEQDSVWAEAWTIRRLLRERTVRELRERGVPVTPWEGPASLTAVLLALRRSATVPTMRRS